jgi:hypothetical protein
MTLTQAAAVLFVLLATATNGLSQTNPDGSFTIPIYVTNSQQPDNYIIYASVGGSALQPYLFDTGSPNLFTTVPGGTITGTGSFSFAQNITYGYNLQNTSIGLGTEGQQTIVSTGNIGVANITTITDGSGTNVIPPNLELSDNTYGDFGASGYGTNTLATVLTQVPLSNGLKEGYIVNVAGKTSGAGSLTLGLSAAAIQAFQNTPGAIVLPMSLTGSFIPTATGSIEGFNKAQVADTMVTISTTSGALSKMVGTVFDTGGGPNAIVYDPSFAGLGGGDLTISYDSQDILDDPGTTGWGGSVIADSNTSGGIRVNPGGSIYQDYAIMFDLTDQTVTLIPDAIPEPTATSASLTALALLLVARIVKSRQPMKKRS